MTHVIITKVIGQGTKTFKFNSFDAAKSFAATKLNRLVYIMEKADGRWISIL